MSCSPRPRTAVRGRQKGTGAGSGREGAAGGTEQKRAAGECVHARTGHKKRTKKREVGLGWTGEACAHGAICQRGFAAQRERDGVKNADKEREGCKGETSAARRSEERERRKSSGCGGRTSEILGVLPPPRDEPGGQGLPRRLWQSGGRPGSVKKGVIWFGAKGVFVCVQVFEREQAGCCSGYMR